MAQIKAEAGGIIARYQGRLDALAESLDKELSPVVERLKTLRQAVQEEMTYFQPPIPSRPEPLIEGTDESGWLFDTGRDYLEQLEVYKARKEGSA
jgi:hypothetical protein